MEFLTQSTINKIKHMTFIPIRFMYGPGKKCGMLQIKPHKAPLFKPHHKDYYNVDDVTIDTVLHTHKYDYSFNEIKKMYEKRFSLNLDIATGYDATFIPKKCLWRSMTRRALSQCTFACDTPPYSDFYNQYVLNKMIGNRKSQKELLRNRHLFQETADQYLIPNLYHIIQFLKTAKWYSQEADGTMYLLTYNKATKSMECMFTHRREMGLDYHTYNIIELQNRLFKYHNPTPFIVIPVGALEFLSEDQLKWLYKKEKDDFKGLAEAEKGDGQLPLWDELQHDSKQLAINRTFRDTILSIKMVNDKNNRFQEGL